MFVLSSNVRGLTNIPRQKVVHRLIDSEVPNVVFIQETKITVDGLDSCASHIWPREIGRGWELDTV